jgi:hypothetical protein
MYTGPASREIFWFCHVAEVLRRLYKRQEETEGWRKLHNKEFYSILSIQYYYVHVTENKEMRRADCKRDRNEKRVHKL